MAIDQFTVSQSSVAERLSQALDLLLINLGSRCFGVPLADVRYICSMPPSFAGYGPATNQHFVFQDNPLPYVSLWNLLGLTSEYAEYEAMLESLPKRRQDHIDWMNALEDAIRHGTTFAKARNPRECAFGSWYYGYRTQNMRLSLILHQFEHPHEHIHHLADKLLGLVEAGQGDQALRQFREAKETTLAELLTLFDMAQGLVANLQRRIAVIVDDGDDACVIGADGVRDIVAVSPERIKPSTCKTSHARQDLIVLDDQTVVPLIDAQWRGFARQASI